MLVKYLSLVLSNLPILDTGHVILDILKICFLNKSTSRLFIHSHSLRGEYEWRDPCSSVGWVKSVNECSFVTILIRLRKCHSLNSQRTMMTESGAFVRTEFFRHCPEIWSYEIPRTLERARYHCATRPITGMKCRTKNTDRQKKSE